MGFKQVHYGELNSRQQEAYNFQKVSGVLADFGFTTIRLSDDWQGADFIAQHIDGKQFLKVQLKGRCTLAQKYEGKDIYICFNDSGFWYLVPHDELLSWVKENMRVASTASWTTGGLYSFPTLSAAMRAQLEPYKLVVEPPAVQADGHATGQSAG